MAYLADDVIRVRSEMRQANADLKLLAKNYGLTDAEARKLTATLKAEARAADKLEAQQRKLAAAMKAQEGQVKRSESTWRKLGKASIALAAGVIAIKKGYDALLEGGKQLDIEVAFRNLGGSMERVERVSRALGGTVSDAMIRKNFNMARTLKISADDFERLNKIAYAASLTLGISVAEASEKVTMAVARQSRKRADDIGILISATAANEKYARSLGKTVAELTDLQKAQAFANEFIAQGNVIIEKAPIDSYAAKVQRVGAAWENATDRLKQYSARFAAMFVEDEQTRRGGLLRALQAQVAARAPSAPSALRAGGAFGGVAAARDSVVRTLAEQSSKKEAAERKRFSEWMAVRGPLARLRGQAGDVAVAYRAWLAEQTSKSSAGSGAVSASRARRAELVERIKLAKLEVAQAKMAQARLGPSGAIPSYVRPKTVAERGGTAFAAQAAWEAQHPIEQRPTFGQRFAEQFRVMSDAAKVAGSTISGSMQAMTGAFASAVAQSIVNGGDFREQFRSLTAAALEMVGTRAIADGTYMLLLSPFAPFFGLAPGAAATGAALIGFGGLTLAAASALGGTSPASRARAASVGSPTTATSRSAGGRTDIGRGDGGPTTIIVRVGISDSEAHNAVVRASGRAGRGQLRLAVERA